ncbi:endonuclease/exonuclease/phosphatase family protein [Bacteroidota bacterium]
MKRTIFQLLVLMLVIPMAAQESINVMTYNIRLNTAADGEHAWPHRKDDVVSVIRFHQADIFCLQEVVHNQMEDLKSAFPDFDYVGVGRDDGISAGEYSPVFFDKSRFKKMDGGTFWLSETPDKPGLGWDAACIRICSWVQLLDHKTGNHFYVFNTHFDHIGTLARANAAKLIVKKIEELATKGNAILCGDFNLPPESAPIKMISHELRDSYYVTELPPHGSLATFLGFTYDSEARSRIDYIFVSEEIKVKRYGALTDSRDRSFFSDHIPVLVEIEID